jgi:hypothetical protein
MSSFKRATVYFAPELHAALRIKAAATGQSLSDMVNSAVRACLQEDAGDLAAFDSRATDADIAFDDVLKYLRL